ncbi:winged helix-turn-helix domain-containing protein [Methanosalsum natronophilum]|uniref:Transcriptional regulator n=1 Tax=Methanosalsum natronophilum TaxID=768733 RepID=A0A3R7XUX7_9EURY|nr:winged helix-turn-helix domain-containing protein [Methanosalsum natronophilum]MCS3923490.1 putative transcriptional regulator [Methanosalsum natronophilum]RQD86548.1 MAG: transcriptional regulator [Methanosalsum natronophilum]
MDELIGFVTGSNNRQKVLSILGSKGPADADRIAKITHIFKPSAEKLLNELIEKELIEKKGEMYQLTKLGEDINGEIHTL